MRLDTGKTDLSMYIEKKNSFVVIKQVKIKREIEISSNLVAVAISENLVWRTNILPSEKWQHYLGNIADESIQYTKTILASRNIVSSKF